MNKLDDMNISLRRAEVALTRAEAAMVREGRRTRLWSLVVVMMMLVASVLLAGNFVIELTDRLRAAGINPF